MKNHAVVIYGAWYHGNVVAETIRELGWHVAGFVDPDPPAGTQTLSALPRDTAIHVAIGDNELRAEVTRKLRSHSRPLLSVVHPSARVSPSAMIGEGVFIGENAVVRTDAHVGAGSLLQSGAVVSHHCRIGDFTSLGPNAAVASHAHIGDGASIGVGASVAPWTRLGRHCVVAAGAAVMKDVPDGKTVVGNPARRGATVPPPGSRHSDWSRNRTW